MLPLVVRDLGYRYGDRMALRDVSLEVRPGEIFGLLGPNGSGKSTLFRVASTLVPPTTGEVQVFGHPLPAETALVRRHLGVVFQAPAVDGKLTVGENVRYHGRLYGLRGAALERAAGEVLERLGVADREADLVETLSGGLRRRVELAKALMHRPSLLLLDEPSTGLDPRARRDLGVHLERLRDRDGVSVLLTTHHMDEAERCDRVAILHHGSLIGVGTPEELKAAVGGDVLEIQARDPAALATAIRSRFGWEVRQVDGLLRLERPRGHDLVGPLVDAFPGEVVSIRFGKPTLEDVFVHFTGQRFWAGDDRDAA